MECFINPRFTRDGDSVVIKYTSAFGEFVIPDEVMARARRLERRFGRVGYLDDWCRHQWSKGAR